MKLQQAGGVDTCYELIEELVCLPRFYKFFSCNFLKQTRLSYRNSESVTAFASYSCTFVCKPVCITQALKSKIPNEVSAFLRNMRNLVAQVAEYS